MARRSARLASVSKTPSKPSLDGPSLASVAERADSPGDGAAQSLDALMSSPTSAPKTPGFSSPMKPPMSEMHPSKVHGTMAPPSSGLRLGFTDIKPSSSRSGLPAAVLSTPSKVTPPSTDFTFTFARQAASSVKLGPEAQKMMEELRGEAQKIKAELAAKRDAEKAQEEPANSRRIAPAKGKAGRYSAVHMAEFKKMDSIANHPSAFRAQPGRVTPLKQGIKRSQSKANLDDTDAAGRSKQPTPASTAAKNGAGPATANEPLSPIKRIRQNVGDDTSSNRPISRDGGSLPRPKSSGTGSAIPRSKSSFASLMTPTKSSLARTSNAKTPLQGSLLKSPSKVNIGGLPRSATTNNLSYVPLDAKKTPEKPVRRIKSPISRLERVKSLLRGAKPSAAKPASALPLPSSLVSKALSSARLDKSAMQAPLATPRKLTKRVAFTPDTQRAALAQNSPSPVKSGIPQSKSRQVLGEVYYPALDAIMIEENLDRGLSYPDLSARQSLTRPPAKVLNKGNSAEPSAPGTFSFRSDHTIRFGSASPSFGTSPGQASVRPVRPSILPTENMPGSFPSPTTMSIPNKENVAPETVFLALPHGMKNKKRNRVSTDEEEAEQEAVERAAKKRKQETVPEGDALLAPRLTGGSADKLLSSPRKLMSPGYAGGTPSPAKKRGALSLSRLNMLSRPKLRK
ncbi:hypothetical protein B0T24DRAFT_356272 [Lasiosphaeria ovina]|uniref:Erythromycin esterase n=1 Tax=Lasiosphaeria ovina TaxID=92902 RepID=A0AAE0N3B1_9PEZI|nr:hypothetical protein B0T24DRAFT_356272 [Lasiosphaeria ovina]